MPRVPLGLELHQEESRRNVWSPHPRAPVLSEPELQSIRESCFPSPTSRGWQASGKTKWERYIGECWKTDSFWEIEQRIDAKTSGKKASWGDTLRKALWLISPHRKHKLSLGELEALGVKKKTIITTSFKLSPNLARSTLKA